MADLTEQQLLSQDPEVLGLQRQRALANLLTGQAFNAPQGQVISGRYVKPSGLQQALPMINAAIGGLTNANLDTKQTELAAALRGKEMQAAQQYATATTPQARMAAAMSPYAPQMIKTAFAERMKPQKIGADESLVAEDFGTGQFAPMYQGPSKLPSVLDVAVSLIPGLSRNRAEWTPEQTTQVENKVRQLEKDKASVTHINMPSETERKAGTMVNILDKNLQQMQTALGVDPSAVKPNVPASIVEAITGPNLLSRTMKPAQRQVIEDAQLDILDAALTLRTGAAYTREQLLGYREAYFPRLGDKPDAINAKKQRLENLIDSAYISSGRATPPRTSMPYTPSLAQPNANQQLNIPNMKLPPGVTQQLWNVMTPEEKAAFK
jgi:hypothetical protein